MNLKPRRTRFPMLHRSRFSICVICAICGFMILCALSVPGGSKLRFVDTQDNQFASIRAIRGSMFLVIHAQTI